MIRLGPNKRLISKDGLHLSMEGTDIFARNIHNTVERAKDGLAELNTCNVKDSDPPVRTKYILLIQHKLSTDASGSCTSINVKQLGGGNDTPMMFRTDRKLTHQEAADLLNKKVKDNVAFDPPYRPDSGAVYVFDDSGDSDRKEDWRADGYTWKNNGRKVCESCGKRIQRIFFKITNQGKPSDAFQKHAFRFVGNDYNVRTIIVYYGDKESYQGLPHGNRKRNGRQHKRTLSSVIKKIKSYGLDQNPKDVADKITSEASPDSNIRGIKVPRNDKQVRNIQCNQRKQAKLSHDALYGLHLLVPQLGEYIMSIKTTPDLEVVVGNTEIMAELN